jgi:serine/threonine protein kinase
MLNDDIKENFSEKIDIWALGCCLYFLSSKEDPFHHLNTE